MKKVDLKRSLSCVLFATMLIASLSGCANSVKNTTFSVSSAVQMTKPAAKEIVKTDRKPVGSFIQSWYVRDWTEARWDKEFTEMKKAGFQFIILQSIVDLSYDCSAENKASYKENYAEYPSKGVSSLYPSSLPELKDAKVKNDAMELCFKSAQKNGMKVMVGLISDDRWWLFGWGIPQAASGVTDLINGSYFAKWVKENGELSNKIAQEVNNKYIKRYSNAFYGWYYNNEIWNMTDACKGKDSGILSKILTNSFNISLDYYNKLTPGKPFLLSPYCNRKLSTAQEYKKMWVDTFKNTHFRSGDLFCPQDSIGGHPDELKVLDKWTSAYKEAVDTKPGLKFWVNIENFTSDSKPAYLDRFAKQLAISAKYCENNIIFSWNHYYCPLAKDAGFNTTYLDMIKNGKLDNDPPEKPAVTYSKSGSSYDLEIKKPKDNCDVAGYKVYLGDSSTLIEDVEAQKNDTVTFYTVNSVGTYYVLAYDYALNESDYTKVDIK